MTPPTLEELRELGRRRDLTFPFSRGVFVGYECALVGGVPEEWHANLAAIRAEREEMVERVAEAIWRSGDSPVDALGEQSDVVQTRYRTAACAAIAAMEDKE